MPPEVTAVTNAVIYPVDEAFSCFNPGSIVFDQQAIIALGPTDTTPVPDGAQVFDAGGRLALLPGLIDTHSHSSLLKAFGEDAQLMDWLPEYQREHQALSEEDAYCACLISYLESLKGGTTTVMDMYRFLHMGAKAAAELGMRVHLVPYAADHPPRTSSRLSTAPGR